jgi:hypothetical protein
MRDFINAKSAHLAMSGFVFDEITRSGYLKLAHEVSYFATLPQRSLKASPSSNGLFHS